MGGSSEAEIRHVWDPTSINRRVSLGPLSPNPQPTPTQPTNHLAWGLRNPPLAACLLAMRCQSPMSVFNSKCFPSLLQRPAPTQMVGSPNLNRVLKAKAIEMTFYWPWPPENVDGAFPWEHCRVIYFVVVIYLPLLYHNIIDLWNSCRNNVPIRLDIIVYGHIIFKNSTLTCIMRSKRNVCPFHDYLYGASLSSGLL